MFEEKRIKKRKRYKNQSIYSGVYKLSSLTVLYVIKIFTHLFAYYFSQFLISTFCGLNELIFINFIMKAPSSIFHLKPLLNELIFINFIMNATSFIFHLKPLLNELIFTNFITLVFFSIFLHKNFFIFSLLLYATFIFALSIFII